MFIRLTIAVVVAIIVSGFYFGHQSSENTLYALDLSTMLSFLFATVVTVLLANIRTQKAENDDDYIQHNKPKKILSAEREEGTVKWFNVSKGYGFITRNDGDQVFVHYRSIRGQGRRRLFEGQVVSFIIIDSDKGPQADDVDIIR